MKVSHGWDEELLFLAVSIDRSHHSCLEHWRGETWMRSPWCPAPSFSLPSWLSSWFRDGNEIVLFQSFDCLQRELNPNKAGLLDVAWERGGGWISLHLLDHLKTLWKNKFFFDFLEVHNELGKVTKFWTSRPLFSWRNSHLKKGRADSAPLP